MQSCVASQDSSQSGAPLQLMVQSWVHPVIVHDVEPWQVRVQSLPAQSIVHEPPVQVCVQSPPAHCIEHAASVHVWEQSPPAQSVEQVDPDAHAYWQSPLAWQVSVQEALAAQLHVPPWHTKPDEAPPGGVPPLPLLPPHPTRRIKAMAAERSVFARMVTAA